MVALPSGILARQDLIRLVAYDQENVHLPHTTFTILENDDKVPFAIRLEDGKGVVYTLRNLEDRQTYKFKVEAKSTDHRRPGVHYETTFMIYISVSSFPY
jgi:hemicentin